MPTRDGDSHNNREGIEDFREFTRLPTAPLRRMSGRILIRILIILPISLERIKVCEKILRQFLELNNSETTRFYEIFSIVSDYATLFKWFTQKS